MVINPLTENEHLQGRARSPSEPWRAPARQDGSPGLRYLGGWGPVAAALALALLLLPACSKSEKSAARKPAATNQTAAAATAAPAAAAPLAMDEEEELITLPAGVGEPADAIPVTPADLAWRQLQQTLQAPPLPVEWQTNEPSETEMAAYKKRYAQSAAQAAERAREFYTKYPDHDKAGAAREQELRLLGLAVQMGDTNQLQKMQAAEQARLNDPKLSEEERLELRLQQLQRDVPQDKGATNMLAKMDAITRTLRKEFPNRPEVLGLMMSVAEGWMRHQQYAQSRALAREVLQADVDPELTGTAREMLKKLDRVGRPLAIKFKALDGREVDLRQLTNKVVLVDFWASWCGPCMVALPNVKAAYNKHHAKGFEILGINLDENKADLERVLQREKITWPQHFDESGDNPLAREFGISLIPTMWLVDKKGVLRDLEAGEQLADKVEKLLGE